MFSFQILLFVLSTAVDGMINGTSGADTLCQREAEWAGLWGSYSALISTKYRPLRNITAEQYRHLPVVNTMVSCQLNGVICHNLLSILVQGHIVSSSWEDLVRWKLRDSPLLTLEDNDIRKGQW